MGDEAHLGLKSKFLSDAVLEHAVGGKADRVGIVSAEQPSADPLRHSSGLSFMSNGSS